MEGWFQSVEKFGRRLVQVLLRVCEEGTGNWKAAVSLWSNLEAGLCRHSSVAAHRKGGEAARELDLCRARCATAAPQQCTAPTRPMPMPTIAAAHARQLGEAAPTRQELGDLLVSLAGGGGARLRRCRRQHLLIRLEVVGLRRRDGVRIGRVRACTEGPARSRHVLVRLSSRGPMDKVVGLRRGDGAKTGRVIPCAEGPARSRHGLVRHRVVGLWSRNKGANSGSPRENLPRYVSQMRMHARQGGRSDPVPGWAGGANHVSPILRASRRIVLFDSYCSIQTDVKPASQPAREPVPAPTLRASRRIARSSSLALLRSRASRSCWRSTPGGRWGRGAAGDEPSGQVSAGPLGHGTGPSSCMQAHPNGRRVSPAVLHERRVTLNLPAPRLRRLRASRAALHRSAMSSLRCAAASLARWAATSALAAISCGGEQARTSSMGEGMLNTHARATTGMRALRCAATAACPLRWAT